MTVSAVPLPLAGRVVVVTGGNRGIGRSVALAMAAAGAAVALGAREVSALTRVRQEVEDVGGCATAATCDVADPGSVDSFGDLVLDRWGRVDAVVANAGISGPTRMMHEIDPDEWRECLEVDLTGVYLTFRRFIPHLIERRTGSLLAVSSITGKRPLIGRTPYAAAKMGVIGLIRTLAVELGPYGIRANSVCPGFVDGPRIRRVFDAQARARGISAETATGEHVDPAALKRLVRAEEVAGTCVFLTSDAAAGITGEDLNVTAGLPTY